MTGAKTVNFRNLVFSLIIEFNNNFYPYDENSMTGKYKNLL